MMLTMKWRNRSQILQTFLKVAIMHDASNLVEFKIGLKHELLENDIRIIFCQCYRIVP